MQLKEAMSIVLEAAEVRQQQWDAVSKGEQPGDVVDELYESTPTEAKEIAARTNEAIAVVRGSV